MKLAHGVAYHVDDQGRVTVNLLTPWDGKPRFPDYPLRIRLKVHADAVFNHSCADTAKLIAAERISKDAAAAVQDDILCKRAEKFMKSQTRFNRQHDTELMASCSGEDPPWLKKLRKRFQEPDQEHDHEQAQ